MRVALKSRFTEETKNELCDFMRLIKLTDPDDSSSDDLRNLYNLISDIAYAMDEEKCERIREVLKKVGGS